MKRKTILSCLLLSLTVLLVSGHAYGQTKEFQLKKLKQYWLDNHDQPWNDLSYQMAVRLDPLYAKDVGSDEISIADPSIKYTTGDWRFYSLQRDAKGTYAEVDYLVYKDSPDPISYEVELRKGNKAVPFLKGSREVKVSNDSIAGPIKLKDANQIFLKDWLFMGGLMLIGLILVYILVFRWLFSGLLFKRRWAVPTAEHFTWSVSLLVLFALAAALTLFYLGPRLETWIVIGVMGAFWLLHGVVWVVSGKQA
jgi:hypothetical protein